MIMTIFTFVQWVQPQLVLVVSSDVTAVSASVMSLSVTTTKTVMTIQMNRLTAVSRVGGGLSNPSL